MHNRTKWLLSTQFFWVLLILAAVLGFRGTLLSWRPAVLVVAVAVCGLVLTGLCGLLVLLARLRARRRDGSSIHCLLAVMLSLPALIGTLEIGMQGTKVPPIHDITTDTKEPPLFQAARTLRIPGENSLEYQGEIVASQQLQAYPDIKPLETSLPPAEAFARSLAVAEKLGWRIIGQAHSIGQIEAVDRTAVFGFTDDIIVRIAAAGNGSRIDLRSASRAGVSDLGVNAKRIRAFSHIFNSL